MSLFLRRLTPVRERSKLDPFLVTYFAFHVIYIISQDNQHKEIRAPLYDASHHICIDVSVQITDIITKFRVGNRTFRLEGLLYAQNFVFV